MQAFRAVKSIQPMFTLTRNVAKSVPIILMQDMWNLGKKGEIVTVRPGYMRNYLYPNKIAVYDVELNRKKLGIDTSIVPHKPVKGEPTPEEMERRRPKGYKITLDSFERDDDAGNISDMQNFNMEIVNNKLSISVQEQEERKKIKKANRHNRKHKSIREEMKEAEEEQ